MSSVLEQYDTDTLVEEQLSQNLIIYNDNVNTFDHVAETLIDICKHTLVQAEQCTMFIHTKGKYAVKEGDYKKLNPLKDAIIERGIKATIE